MYGEISEMKRINFLCCVIGALTLTGCNNEPASITADCSMKRSGNGMCVFHNKGGEGAKCVIIEVIADLGKIGGKVKSADGVSSTGMSLTSKEVCSGKLQNEEIIERTFSIPTNEFSLCENLDCTIDVVEGAS